MPNRKPIISNFFSKLLHRENLYDDLIAGVTVGLVLVPQSLAYAQLAGMPAHYGLYASLLPPVIAAFFGSSPQLSTGPVAVLSLMTYAAVSPLAEAGSPEYIAYAILLAFLLGIFQIILGLGKLGELASLLSHPVIYGFTNAAAIIIATTQLSSFLGVSVPSQEYHFHTIYLVIQKAFTTTNLGTLGLGCVVLSSMLLIRLYNRKLPAVLIVVVLTTAFVWLTGYDTPTVGHIPQGIPSFSLPNLEPTATLKLIIPMITMALIGFTESISVAQAIAIKTRQRIDPNRELLGQGLANVLGSSNLGFPVSGSFSRTALNFQSGAQTWISSLITSILILTTLLFLTPLIYFLPKVVLAAIIVISVSSLIDFSKIRFIWKINRNDGIASSLTFLGTLIFAPDLEVGIIFGVIFSLGHFVYRNTHPHVAFLSRYRDGTLHDAFYYHLDQCQNIAVVRLDAPLFFANATFFENEIIHYLATHKRITNILFVANGINDIDATGLEMLSSFIQTLKASQKQVYFSVVKDQIYATFTKAGITRIVGAQRFFETTREGVEFLLNQLTESHSHVDSRRCPLIKYIHIPVNRMHTQKSHRDKIAYMYQRLFYLINHTNNHHSR